MNERTQLVFRGWIGLSAQERQELAEEIRRYQQGSPEAQRQLREGVQKVDLGPVGRGCPCCGR